MEAVFKKYKRAMAKKIKKSEPYIYVDGIKSFQQLPQRMEIILCKIKMLKIQKKNLKREGRRENYDNVNQIIDDFNFLEMKLEELQEELEEEEEEFF